MTAVQLRLLGGFGLDIDGIPVDMTPAAQRLLAFVALTPRGAERSYTAFQLWPEQSEERARANLRSALWRLSKVPTQLVTATKTHLRLYPAVWVDVRHGLSELAQAGLDAVVAAALPFQALDADLLPDWYDDWLSIERERLRQLRLGSLEEAAGMAIQTGRHGHAVQLALAAVAVDPLRESGHRLAIEAHLANGNQVEARRQFEVCRRLLAGQIGCEPSRRLAALLESSTAGPAGTGRFNRPLLVAV